MRTGFSPTGLIAILRGLTPDEAVAIGHAVSDAGIGILEEAHTAGAQLVVSPNTDVLPAWAELIPVGGIDASSFQAWTAAGATGFGVGSALYRAGMLPSDVADRARALQSAWEQASTSLTRGARS
jgi:2-dehydro-3-deoxyphosphogalactonate aldolase